MKREGGKNRASAGKKQDNFEDFKDEIDTYPDLASLSRLHETINKVKNKQKENGDKLELLQAAYDQLKKQVKVVRDEQNMTTNAGAAIETKKDDKKK